MSPMDVLHPLPERPDIYWIEVYDPQTYHAQSYLLVHPEGNILIDVPAYRKEVIRALQERGGVRYIFITHKDDIGSAGTFQEFFHARIILHRSEAHYVRDGQVDIAFDGDLSLYPDVVIVHLPGHTPGSAALLDLRAPAALFCGDAINVKDTHELFVPRHPFDFDARLKRITLRKLLQYPFELVLPAHPAHPGLYLPAGGRQHLEQLLRRIL